MDYKLANFRDECVAANDNQLKAMYHKALIHTDDGSMQGLYGMLCCAVVELQMEKRGLIN